MTNENEEIEKTLNEISKLPEKERPARLREIAIKYGVYDFSADSPRDTYTLFKNIHIYLQSKMMLNACVSAEESCKLSKRSCFWAAMAAILSFVTAFITAIAAFVSIALMLYQIIKGR